MTRSRAGRRVGRRLKGGSSSRYIGVFLARFVTSGDADSMSIGNNMLHVIVRCLIFL